jgi:hypothetical protein
MMFVKAVKAVRGAAVAVGITATGASATSVTLDFTLPATEEVTNYYSGGTDQNGATGPNYGISFSPAIIAEVGGDADSGAPPGGGNLIYLGAIGSGLDTMNVAGGFTDSFSLYYDGYDRGSGVINIWSGLNDTGSLLASLTVPGGQYWTFTSTTFSGVAESVDFSNTVRTAFADITLGNVAPVASVPDHTGWGTYGIAGLGLLGMCQLFRKREKAIV